MRYIHKFFLFFLFLPVTFSIEANTNMAGVQFTKKQIEANHYVQKAILPAWYAKRNSPFYPPNYTQQLNYFKKAELVDPHSIRLGFYLASTYILQNKMNQAILVYQHLINQFPNSFNAGILYAIYNKIIGKNDKYHAEIKHLCTYAPIKTQNYLELIERTLKIAKMGFSSKVTKINKSHLGAIILGAGLTADGKPTQLMLDRLKKLLALYLLNKNMLIVVTGGVAQNGITESYVMKQWLLSKGVPDTQIYIEDRARDTVENAYYSLKIVSELHLNNIVIITNGFHIRRAYSLFLEMILYDKLNIKLSGLATSDVKPSETDKSLSTAELVGIFRDTLRASGIWLYPALRL